MLNNFLRKLGAVPRKDLEEFAKGQYWAWLNIMAIIALSSDSDSEKIHRIWVEADKYATQCLEITSKL